jgi:polyvinyl alcohol dehydrogenase (cytochrome)
MDITRFRRFRTLACAFMALLLAGTGAAAAAEWRNWGGGRDNARQALAEQRISPATVHQLALRQVFETGGDVAATPTVDGSAVYFPDFDGNLYALDRRSGALLWARRVSEFTGDSKSKSRSSPAVSEHLLIIGDLVGGRIIAVDKTSGSVVWVQQVETFPGAFITSSPVIFGNRVFVGVASVEEGAALVPGETLSFRGSVVALDLASGQTLWRRYTVPEGYTGGSVWGSAFSIDPARGRLYVSTGNNYSVPDSVDACIVGAADAAAQDACLAPGDYVNAVLALDLASGEVVWGRRISGPDAWTASCVIYLGGAPCGEAEGQDYDFGQAPMLIHTVIDGQPRSLLGLGQKSGMFWALNPDDGNLVWSQRVGPGGLTGGIMWGSATDGKRVYVALANAAHTPFKLGPEFEREWNAGAWAALDAATGAFIWQIPATGRDPESPRYGAEALGPLTVANGVVFAPSMSGDMVAIDAARGAILWKYTAAGSVFCGPSVVDGTVYWGAGYSRVGTGDPHLYVFSMPDGEPGKRSALH